MATRALACTVVLQGEVYNAGDVPPDRVAALIRNPACWKTLGEEPAVEPAPAPAQDPPAVETEPATTEPATGADVPADGIIGPDGTLQPLTPDDEEEPALDEEPQTDTVAAPPAQPAEDGVASDTVAGDTVEAPPAQEEVGPPATGADVTAEPVAADVVDAQPDDGADDEESLDEVDFEDVEDDGDDPTAVPEPPRAGPGSGLPAWRAFATDRGVDFPAASTRDQIVALCEQANVLS